MNYLISLFLLCTFSWGIGVEFDIPMFSEKVTEQGAKDPKASTNCIATQDATTGQQSLTCGTAKKDLKAEPKPMDMDEHSSEYAKSKAREFRRSQ